MVSVTESGNIGAPSLALLHWHCFTGIASLALLHWHCFTGIASLALLHWHCGR
jgi:hypothetical protein